MRTRLVLNLFLNVVLLSAAHASAADEASPIPRASTERFLGHVRDFGDGRPSPSIIYSTRGVGEAANAPGRALSQGPSVLMLGVPRASQPLSGSSLQGGVIERRTNAPNVIQGGTIERRAVEPYNISSPWR